MQNLFTDSFFRKQKKNLRTELDIDDKQLETYQNIIQKRIDYVENFNLEKDSEEKDWAGFEKDVLRDLLGYAVKDDTPEDYNVFRQPGIRNAGPRGGTGKADCALGFYSRKKRKDADDVVLLEYKAPDTLSLEGGPTDQLWGYLEHHPDATWGIVTNFNEITLYHVSERRLKKQTFYFVVPHELRERKNSLSDDAELLRFLAILRKDRLLAKEGKSVTTQMFEAQGIEEKKVEKEFYTRYYKLRKDLLNEIAEHNPEYRKKRDELVTVTQKILDRLVFVWFCEDSREELLPRDILQRLISARMQTDPELRPSDDIWDTIRQLFKAIDDGSGFSIGRGYNGELFKPDPRIDELIIPNRIFEDQVKKIGEEYDFGHENELSVNILGHIFEQSVSDLEELRREDDAAVSKTGRRKREGIFYTPEYITRYIAEQAMGSWLAEKRKELGENKLPKLTDNIRRKAVKEKWINKKTRPAGKPRLTQKVITELNNAIGDENVLKRLGMLKNINCKNEAEFRETLSAFEELSPWLDTIVGAAVSKNSNEWDIWQAHLKFWSDYQMVLRNVKVLDPACGSGAFLIQAFDMLYREGQQVNSRLSELTDDGNRRKQKSLFDLDRHILENNLHGVDINSESVEITKLSLWLKTADKEKKLNNLYNNIKCGNSLIDVKKIAGEKAFRWEKEFPEIMKSGGFDVVIGNPPYVRADSPGNTAEIRQHLVSSKRYETLSGKWDLYIPFIALSIFLLKENGKSSLIIPDAFCHANYAQTTIIWLKENHYLCQIDYFPDTEVFENVGVKSIIIHNSKKYNDSFIQRIHTKGTSSYTEISHTNIPDNLRLDAKRSLINDSSDCILLNELCYISVGIVGNSHEKYFNGDFLVGDLLSDSHDALHSKLYIEGKDIDKWCLLNRRWIEHGTERSPHKWRRKAFPELFEYGEKLIAMRSPGYNPRILFSTEEIFFNESAIGFRRWCDLTHADNKSLKKSYMTPERRKKIEKISKNFSLKYIAAILNSGLIRYELNTERRSNIHIYPDDWKKLPVLSIGKKEQQPFIEKANQMLTLNKDLAGAKADLSDYLKHNFHLEKFSRKLAAPENQTFEDYAEELRKNDVNTENSTVYKSVKEYFTNIATLKTCIDNTDREIDQMVFSLYGLTEEEINIISSS